MVYQLKIQLHGVTKPPIWRRILIPSTASFLDLHHIIQDIFECTNEHYFEFSLRPYDSDWTISYDEVGEELFGESEPMGSEDARETAIGEFLNPLCPKINYTYDFRKDWFHTITLENADVQNCADPEHAHCIAGKGCPIPEEDCGGVYSFGRLKALINSNPEAAVKAALEYDDEKDVDDIDDSDGLGILRWLGLFYELTDYDKPDFATADIEWYDELVSKMELQKIEG